MRARRAELRDVFHEGDESVVMAGANVVRLSRLATYLLEQMADWRSSDELAADLIQRFGDPPGGNAISFIEATLAELEALEIVEIQLDELEVATSEDRDVLAALIARVARDAGLDVLLIKGPSLAVHGLRDERAWGDVDVLVRPDHVSALRRELSSRGWEPFNETPEFPLITLPHAITFIHPRWHTEIDVHTFLPGSYADAATTFEHLWGERTTIQLAHQPVLCTGRVGSALVAALNLARSPARPRTRAEAPLWCTAVRRWPDRDRIALADLAAECCAADVLAPLFDAAGVPAIGRGKITPQNWVDWHDRVGRDTRRGYAWASAIRRAPAGQRMRLAIRALTYDPAATQRGESQPTGWALIRHLIGRIGLAMSLLLRRRQ